MSETPSALSFNSTATDLRFGFGKNWYGFLDKLDNAHLEAAKESLRNGLNCASLAGKSFLDIGSGSGLFSLAARSLGASVTSFDFDADSVRATEKLKALHFPEDPCWQVLRGSVLAPTFLRSLGSFDIVYSWGVLHHTGDMWASFRNILESLNSGGTLFISIYNDQGMKSSRWKEVKKLYNRLPSALRFLVLYPAWLRLWGPTVLSDLLRSGNPFSSLKIHKNERGMSPWHDVVDWVGGYPFEVASPEQVFDFFHSKGFELSKLKTCAGGIGCNEFVFRHHVAPLHLN